METIHYISSEILQLETLQEIISQHKSLALSEEAKINIQKCRDYLDKKMAEEGKVAMRNIRRDAIDGIKKLEKDGLPKDAIKDLQDEVQALTDRFIVTLDKATDDKESEIMER